MMNIKYLVGFHLFLHYSIYFKDMLIKSWVQEIKAQITMFFVTEYSNIDPIVYVNFVL